MSQCAAADRENLRIYAWVTRSEVAYLQAIIDAYEGIGRVRTEKHDLATNRSLLLFLVPPSRRSEFENLLKDLALQVAGGIEFI